MPPLFGRTITALAVLPIKTYYSLLTRIIVALEILVSYKLQSSLVLSGVLKGNLASFFKSGCKGTTFF